MNKKIIGILSAVTLLSGAVYLSSQGGFGSLSSSVLSEEEVCSIESYEEQISTIENNIALAQEKIQTQQQSIQKDNENITTLSQTLRERQAALKQAQSDKKKCGTGRSINQSCIKKADTYISNLQDAIKNLENKIKENKTAISETKKNITTQQKNIKTWKRDIASLSQEKTQCEERINTVNPETGGDLPPANPETGGDLPPPENLPPANPETEGSENTTTAPATIIPLLTGTSGETECNKDVLTQRESEFFDIYLKLWEYSRGAYGSKQGVGYTVAGTVESLQNQINQTKQKIDNLEDKVENLKTRIAALGTSSRDNKKRGELTTELNTTKNDLAFQKNKYLPALKDALQIAIQKGVEINLYQSTFLGYQKSYQDCLVSLNIPVEGSRVCGAGAYANNCLLANGDFSGGFNRKS